MDLAKVDVRGSDPTVVTTVVSCATAVVMLTATYDKVDFNSDD